ncbi:MAG: hypothetical protein Q7T20_16295 [Saprospiraceae bacterium]|nr:hypothetical protein [Saprospiraceae bacterium]
MSKKRFSEGLDDLFSSSHANHGEVFGSALVLTAPSSATDARKHSGHKSFMNDLDTLLQEALDESLERYEANQPDSVSGSSKTKATNPNALRAPARSGLDTLIRQTIDVQELATDESTGKKRLTVSVDRPKLEKLKAIAKLENAFLKDLLVSLIDEYIDEYTQQKGVAL